MYREFTAEQNNRVVSMYLLGASKVLPATGFGQAEFPILYWISLKNLL